MDISFAERLKEIRAQHRITQDDLAKILECSRYRVIDMERGKVNPNVDDIKRLYAYFGISADYLLGLSDIQTRNSDIKSICEYTGLTETAVGVFHSEKVNADAAAKRREEQGDSKKTGNENIVDLRNDFIENHYLSRLCETIARAYFYYEDSPATKNAADNIVNLHSAIAKMKSLIFDCQNIMTGFVDRDIMSKLIDLENKLNYAEREFFGSLGDVT